MNRLLLTVACLAAAAGAYVDHPAITKPPAGRHGRVYGMVGYSGFGER